MLRLLLVLIPNLPDEQRYKKQKRTAHYNLSQKTE
jgi:hypothetical protein